MNLLKYAHLVVSEAHVICTYNFNTVIILVFFENK